MVITKSTHDRLNGADILEGKEKALDTGSACTTSGDTPSLLKRKGALGDRRDDPESLKERCSLSIALTHETAPPGESIKAL